MVILTNKVQLTLFTPCILIIKIYIYIYLYINLSFLRTLYKVYSTLNYTVNPKLGVLSAVKFLHQKWTLNFSTLIIEFWNVNVINLLTYFLRQITFLAVPSKDRVATLSVDLYSFIKVVE